MKTSLIHLASAVAVAAALVPLMSYAETRLVSHGRAGYIVVHVPERTANANQRETNVALVMEKPRESRTTLQTMGRAGYQYTPARETRR
jgi:hypothetical protein